MFIDLPNALWTWTFRSVTTRTSFINTWWPEFPFDVVSAVTVCVSFVLHVCKTWEFFLLALQPNFAG